AGGRAPADHEAGTGDVEAGPGRQLPPAHHLAAEPPGRAQQPVGEVPRRAPEQQPERHRPGQAVQPPRGAHDEDDHAYRDQGEQNGHPRAEAERGPAVAHQVQGEQRAYHLDLVPGGKGGNHDDLRDHVRGEDGRGDTEQQAHPARPARLLRAWLLHVQRLSSRCLHVTHRVARGNACRRAFPIGWPHDSHTPKVPSSIRASARSLAASSSRAFWVSASSCSRWNVLAPASAGSSPASPTASLSRSATADSAWLMSAVSPAISDWSCWRTFFSSASVQGFSPGRTGRAALAPAAVAMVCLPRCNCARARSMDLEYGQSPEDISPWRGAPTLP